MERLCCRWQEADNPRWIVRELDAMIDSFAMDRPAHDSMGAGSSEVTTLLVRGFTTRKLVQ